MHDHPYERFLMKRIGRRKLLTAASITGAAAVVTACGGKASSGEPSTAGSSTDASESGDATSVAASSVARPNGWTDATHGKEAKPDYATVFPLATVNTLTFVVSPEKWTEMLKDMTALYGERGVEGQDSGQDMIRGGGAAPQPGAFPGGGGQLPAPDGGAAPQPGAFPGGGGRVPGGGPGTAENPAWVPGSVLFDGREWTNVGIRFKGNSSLMSAWRSGTDKLPFKLDFDEFDGDFPEIADQRFHGFRQLSLGTNLGDATHLRETLAYDTFEQAGLPAANTAIYEVVLDRGEGPRSLGLYTAIEVIDDTVVERVFAEGNGNIYEADGPAASLAAGTQAQIESSFEAEGGDNPDWSDIEALYAAVHAESRLTDAAAWRKGIEDVLDVDGFLEWLAIATTIQHWDTYGGMTHNYYLYNNPDTEKLTWISWDHNFVLGASGGGGMGPDQLAAGDPPDGEAPVPAGGPIRGGGQGGPMGSTSFDKAEVGAEWPLIRYLLDQPEYYDRYLGYLGATADELVDPAKAERRYADVVRSIEEHLPEAEKDAFEDAVASLWTTLEIRRQAARDFLSA